MKNETPRNILVSYAYLAKDKRFSDYVLGLHRDKRINLMIDSGAFSIKNSNATGITLDSYCDWLLRNEQHCEKYVMMDEIGNSEQSKKNYEIMISRGLKPMFVLTMFDNDWEYLKDTLNYNINICVAGGATTKGSWMSQRYQRANKACNGKARIHGLAYVTFPKMLQLPLASVDSSSWTQGLRWGGMCYFDYGKGIKSFSKESVLASPSLLQKKELERYGITPRMLLDLSNTTGRRSIFALMAIYANLKMQDYVKKHNLDYFMAVSSLHDLQSVIWVSEHIYNPDFTKFKRS